MRTFALGMGFLALSVSTANFAFSKECEKPSGLVSQQELVVKIGGKSLKAIVFAAPVHGAAAGDENDCVVQVADIETGTCLGNFRGFRRSGETKVPFYNSKISAFKISESLSALQIDSRYSHGYTEVLTSFVTFDGKQALVLSDPLVTFQVSPSGQEFKTPVEVKDVNGDGASDLVAGKRALVFAPKVGKFQLFKTK